MGSVALREMTARLDDVDQLMQAHRAVGGDLPGRRFEVEGLNRAATVMLTAHFEGYVEDVFCEAFRAIPGGLDPSTIISRFHSPSPDKIDELFAVIGMSEPTKKVSWQRASNTSVLRNLRELVKTRHRIAHGVVGVRVYKVQVVRYRKYVEGFALRFDALVSKRIEQIAGTRPW